MEAVTHGVQEQGVIVQSKHWLLNEQVNLTYAIIQIDV